LEIKERKKELEQPLDIKVETTLQQREMGLVGIIMIIIIMMIMTERNKGILLSNVRQTHPFISL